MFDKFSTSVQTAYSCHILTAGVAREGSANPLIVQKDTPDAVAPQTNGFTLPSIASGNSR